MAQQTDAATTEPTDNTRKRGLASFLGGITMHMNVGLDAKGQSHFHNVQKGLIIVCEGDRRHKGIREEDVEEVHVITEDKTVEDWVQFVQEKRGWHDVRSDLKFSVFGTDGIPPKE
jgi:hypothetical protein